MVAHDDILAALLEQCRLAHHAWLNGDARGYAFTSDTDTIMGPFGDITTGSVTITPGQQRVAARLDPAAARSSSSVALSPATSPTSS